MKLAILNRDTRVNALDVLRLSIQDRSGSALARSSNKFTPSFIRSCAPDIVAGLCWLGAGYAERGSGRGVQRARCHHHKPVNRAQSTWAMADLSRRGPIAEGHLSAAVTPLEHRLTPTQNRVEPAGQACSGRKEGHVGRGCANRLKDARHLPFDRGAPYGRG
jgi:hypothetical protein